MSVPGVLVDTPNTLPQLVLGCLLFCAGLTVETARMPQIRLLRLPASILMTWLIPFITAAVLSLAAKLLGCPDGLILGVIVASVMPIANSSVGWTHLGRGNLPLILGLLIGSTLTGPLVSPWLMQALSSFGLVDDSRILSALPPGQLAWFLGFWVLIPALSGTVVGLWSRKQGIVWSALWLRRVSLTCLLLLNYLNASSTLPLIRSETLVAQGLLLVTINIVSLIVIGWAWGRWSHSDPADRVSFSLACGMRNTGAALVLAGTAFQFDPAVGLTIVLQTLLQNIFAGLLISFAPNDSESEVTACAAEDAESPAT